MSGRRGTREGKGSGEILLFEQLGTCSATTKGCSSLSPLGRRSGPFDVEKEEGKKNTSLPCASLHLVLTWSLGCCCCCCAAAADAAKARRSQWLPSVARFIESLSRKKEEEERRKKKTLARSLAGDERRRRRRTMRLLCPLSCFPASLYTRLFGACCENGTCLNQRSRETVREDEVGGARAGEQRAKEERERDDFRLQLRSKPCLPPLRSTALRSSLRK